MSVSIDMQGPGSDRSGADAEPQLGRDVTLDAIRGAAIILMIVDHALGFAYSTELSQPWMYDARFGVTRLALPGFMVCSGILLARRGISLRRWVEVALAAVVVNGTALAADVPDFVPDILAVWCAVMVLVQPLRRWPMSLAVLGLLQSYYWPLPISSYQPGWVLAFLALGVLVQRTGDLEVLPSVARPMPRWVGSIGRRPLGWYVGHLTVLGALTATGTHLGWW